MPQTIKILNRAKREKNDEFYTRYEDIANEVQHYKEHFKGKTVYCNCDDYRFSYFVKYFKDNFDALQLRCLTATNYDIGDGAFLYINDGTNESVSPLDGNGDFRSDECVRMLKKCDIVCTNPAFSLWREFFIQLIDWNKSFLIIGSQNAISYKVVFPFIIENKLFFGMNAVKQFVQPNGNVKKFGNVCWFTNIPNEKRNRPLELSKHYTPEKYKAYDNYSAINVDKVCDIPMDYDGVMGVPLTYLYYHCPSQFEIVGWSRHNDENMDGGYWLGGRNDATIDGKVVYRRILIKRKHDKQ